MDPFKNQDITHLRDFNVLDCEHGHPLDGHNRLEFRAKCVTFHGSWIAVHVNNAQTFVAFIVGFADSARTGRTAS
jgi:hypothetical protein